MSNENNGKDSFKDKFAFKVEGFESLVDDVKQLLNLDQLIDLAQKLDEKQKSGEIRTEVNVTSRPLSSIPRRSNIPRSPRTATTTSEFSRGDREVTSPDVIKSDVPKVDIGKDNNPDNKPTAIAELISLSNLAHKLEDMLEILQHHEFCARITIAEVLSLCVDEVASVLSQASNLPNNSLVDLRVDLELLQRLDNLLANAKHPQENLATEVEQSLEDSYYPKSQSKSQPKSTISPIVISSLEKNLETCIQQLELQLTTTFLNLSEAKIKEELQYFCDECLMLGDTLKLDWLICIVEPFDSSLQQTEISKLLPNVQVIIDDLRSQCNQYLYVENAKTENPQIGTIAIRKIISKDNSIHSSQSKNQSQN